VAGHWWPIEPRGRVAARWSALISSGSIAHLLAHVLILIAYRRQRLRFSGRQAPPKGVLHGKSGGRGLQTYGDIAIIMVFKNIHRS
jgi:hypothetical protein